MAPDAFRHLAISLQVHLFVPRRNVFFFSATSSEIKAALPVETRALSLQRLCSVSVGETAPSFCWRVLKGSPERNTDSKRYSLEILLLFFRQKKHGSSKRCTFVQKRENKHVLRGPLTAHGSVRVPALPKACGGDEMSRRLEF